MENNTPPSQQKILLQSRLESRLQALFAATEQHSQDLHEAMRYCTLNGGKRIRALLVYGTGLTFGAALEQLDHAAMAVELIHAYSLIHDDLPAMDNADLRRGKPACHKAFSEAIAILTGDALQALAFDLLSQSPYLSAQQQLNLLVTLSQATLAMVHGQAMDIGATLNDTDLHNLSRIHEKKTAALIKASILLGATIANLPIISRDHLAVFGHHLGLAFQIHDDILDVEGITAKLGKPARLDIALGKITYPQLCGLEASKQHRQERYDQAIAALDKTAPSSPLLAYLAAYIIDRDH